MESGPYSYTPTRGSTERMRGKKTTGAAKVPFPPFRAFSGYVS